MTKCDCVCISREEYNRLKECNGNKKPKKPRKKTAPKVTVPKTTTKKTASKRAVPKKNPVQIVDYEDYPVSVVRQSVPRAASVPRIEAPKVKQIAAPKKTVPKKKTAPRIPKKNPIKVVDYEEPVKVKKTAKKPAVKKKTTVKKTVPKKKTVKTDMPTKWAISQIEAPRNVPYNGHTLQRREKLPAPSLPALPKPDLVQNWREQALIKAEKRQIREQRREDRRIQREERNLQREQRREERLQKRQNLLQKREERLQIEAPKQNDSGLLRRRSDVPQLPPASVPQLPGPREIRLENCDNANGFLARRACQRRNRERVS